jgi:SAM-dependent methyltransferase
MAVYHNNRETLALHALVSRSLVVHPSADTDLRPQPKVGMGSTAPYREWEKALKVLARYPRQGIRRILPTPAKHFARQALIIINAVKARVQLTVGVQPIRPPWGFGRGMVPVARYYLEQFLQEFSSDIFGHCLEFQSDDYTVRFGGDRLTKLDILHKEDGNEKATIVADLTKPNRIPSDQFDCIICTYVLHIIFDLDKTVSELYRILRPGGVLLVAVPHVSRIYPNAHEIWRFTPEGLHLILARAFGAENVIVRAYGNSLTAAGAIRGLAAHEFTQAELNYHTPESAVGVFARACKQS